MGVYTFQECSVLEFARLIHTVCKSAPEYRLDGRMCYWSALTIVTLSKLVFHGNGELSSSRAGKYSGLKVCHDNPKEIAEIMEKYLDARTADPVPLGETQREREKERKQAQEALEKAQKELRRERSDREQAQEELEQAQEELEQAQKELRRERKEREQLQAQLAQAQGRERGANEASKS